MSKIKVGIILLSDGFSGAERVIYELLSKFSKKSEAYFFVNEEIKNYYRSIKNIKIIDLGPLFSKRKILWPLIIKRMRKRIIKEVRKLKINILSPHLEYSFIVTPRINEVKIIGVLHGGELLNKNNFLAKMIINNFMKKSDKLILVSNYISNFLSIEYKNKSSVISNGVNSKIFKPLKNIKQKKKIVLFTGRFIERKGFLEMINVAKQLPQYEFWFAGRGPLENLINLPNTKNLGFKKTNEIIKLYNQATICTFPSHWEALPLCGLEAMACKKAVIATPAGFNEYIENGKDGIIIPTKNENALKEAIIKLMTNKKLREKIGKNARQKALKYSWDKIAKKYLEVYKIK